MALWDDASCSTDTAGARIATLAIGTCVHDPAISHTCGTLNNDARGMYSERQYTCYQEVSCCGEDTRMLIALYLLLPARFRSRWVTPCRATPDFDFKIIIVSRSPLVFLALLRPKVLSERASRHALLASRPPPQLLSARDVLEAAVKRVTSTRGNKIATNCVQV